MNDEDYEGGVVVVVNSRQRDYGLEKLCVVLLLSLLLYYYFVTLSSLSLLLLISSSSFALLGILTYSYLCITPFVLHLSKNNSNKSMVSCHLKRQLKFDSLPILWFDPFRCPAPE